MCTLIVNHKLDKKGSAMNKLAVNVSANDELECVGDGEALKYDSGKAPIGLIPHSALVEEALVLGFGCEKYGPHQWRGAPGDIGIEQALRLVARENLDPMIWEN